MHCLQPYSLYFLSLLFVYACVYCVFSAYCIRYLSHSRYTTSMEIDDSYCYCPVLFNSQCYSRLKCCPWLHHISCLASHQIKRWCAWEILALSAYPSSILYVIKWDTSESLPVQAWKHNVSIEHCVTYCSIVPYTVICMSLFTDLLWCPWVKTVIATMVPSA